MFQNTKEFASTVLSLALMLVGSDAIAQVRVLTPAPIPTLSEWGMIILSSLLALGAVITLRRQRQ